MAPLPTVLTPFTNRHILEAVLVQFHAVSLVVVMTLLWPAAAVT